MMSWSLVQIRGICAGLGYGNCDDHDWNMLEVEWNHDTLIKLRSNFDKSKTIMSLLDKDMMNL